MIKAKRRKLIDAAESAVAAAFAEGGLTLNEAKGIVGIAPPYTVAHVLGDFLANAAVGDLFDENELVTQRILGGFSSIALLTELKRRGGHPGALAEAALLCAQKSEDYNQGMGLEDMHSVDRTSYFPFGLISYAQMLHTKVQRLISISKKGSTNFESARDTLLDIVNYAGFGAADDGRPR